MIRGAVPLGPLLLSLVLIAGCASRTRAPEPPADQLRVVTVAAMPGSWSGWSVGIENDPAWFRPTHDWALPRAVDRLAVNGQWYTPEKAASRRRSDMIGQAGMFLPPLFLAGIALIPDASCTALLELPADDGRGVTVGIDWESADGSARAWVKSGWEALLLAEAPCLDGERPLFRHAAEDGAAQTRM